MPVVPIFQDLVPIEVPLSKILLDPNNPRFLGPNSQIIPDESISNDLIQENAQQTLVRDYGIDKLRMNMEVNGYLPIDRVVVRSIPNTDLYVVLEGNRRICAAKMIGPIDSLGGQVTPEVLDSIKTIPCLQYVGGETDAAWIFQGLRHISGITEWSAYNKAKLLVEQMVEEDLGLTEAGRRFGLSSFGAGQWVRGYYAFKQAREDSDFLNEVDERSYPYFQELFSKSSLAVRAWLGWDDQQYKFTNTLNLNEFVGWLYTKDSEEDTSQKGDFEKRRLSRRDDIRQLSFLLTNDEKAFEQFRNGVELEAAYAMASAAIYQKKAEESVDKVQTVFEIMDTCVKALDNIPHKVFKQEALLSSFQERLAALEAAINQLK